MNDGKILLPHHREHLQLSGLTDETMEAAGWYSETSYERIAALLDWKHVPRKMAPAIVIPYRDPDGRNGYQRIRPDNPRDRNGKLIKYEAPRGRPNHVFIPPKTFDVLQNSAIELMVTEGEKKALKADQEGFPCIGISGVFAWKDGKRESLLPALERIAWKGRKVYVAFDSDVADKPEVKDAESRFAKQLTDRGANVKCVRLPAENDGVKNGVDDFLVRHGVGDFRRLLDAAQEAEPPDPQTVKEIATLLDPAREAAEFLDRASLDGQTRLRHWQGEFYWWTGGKYVVIPDDDIKSRLYTFLNGKSKGVVTAVVGNVLAQTKAKCNVSAWNTPPHWLTPHPGFDADPKSLLVTKGKIIDVRALFAGHPDYSRPATPGFFNTSSLGYEFDPNAPQPEAWFSFLDEIWPDDQQSKNSLQEWFGYSLLPTTNQQKILAMIGPKRSGKGTVCRVWRGVVGEDNVAGPTLGSLGTNFGLWPLLGKTLAIISDARLSGRTDTAAIVERLLQISGEDATTIDRKNLRPITTTLPARFVLVSNELPNLRDASGALPSRLIVLRFSRSWFGNEDVGLSDRLRKETPSILVWALVGLQRLWSRGRFVQPESAADLVEDLEDLAAPVGQFVRESCVVEPGKQISASDLFTAWAAWCEVRGRNSGSIQTFGRDLRATLPTVRKTRPRSEEASCGRPAYYEGVGLRPGL